MLAEIIVAWVTIFALAIMVISVFSYRRSNSRKVLLVTVAFALFFVKGVVLSAGLLRPQVDWEMLILFSLLLDTFILLALFAAIILRRGHGR